MTEPPEPAPDPAAAHDRARLRTTWRLLVVGGGLGVVAAGAVAVAGGSGAAGLATLLVVWAFAAAMTGLYTLILGFVDDARRRPVGRRRVATGIGLLALAFVLFVMAVGAAA